MRALILLSFLAACAAQPDPAGLAVAGAPSPPPAPGEPTVAFEDVVQLTGVATLEIVAPTTEKCCAGAADATSPVRLLLTTVEGGVRDGWLLYADAEDRPVLAGQTGPEAYGKILWTGAAGTRTEAELRLTVPVEQLPAGVLRLWAGVPLDLQLAGRALPARLETGKVPAARLDTGRRAVDPGIANDAPPPPGVEPGTGDPEVPAGGGPDAPKPPAGQEVGSGKPDVEPNPTAPPPGQEAGSGAPDKAPDSGPVPAGQKPGTGDPAKPPGGGPLPPGVEPNSGDPARPAPSAAPPPPAGKAAGSGDPDAAASE